MLLDEVLEVLSPREGETYVDCTTGLGGHAAAIAARVGPRGRVILNDVDAGNLSAAAARVRESGAAVTVVRGNFAALPWALLEMGIEADMMLADLGFASSQVDDAARGLSFSREGPLDMRLDASGPVTAADLVNGLPENELIQIIRTFGEEREAGRIARKLVRARESEPITTTLRLAEVVRSALPRRHDPSGIDPATRTFQALRIAVNDEIGSLEALLSWVGKGAEVAAGVRAGEPSWLRAGSRVAVISFHSLEDRPVKHAFSDLVARGLGERLGVDPIVPGEDEIRRNPRSRSAKLRSVRVAGAMKSP